MPARFMLAFRRRSTVFNDFRCSGKQRFRAFQRLKKIVDKKYFSERDYKKPTYNYETQFSCVRVHILFLAAHSPNVAAHDILLGGTSIWKQI